MARPRIPRLSVSRPLLLFLIGFASVAAEADRVPIVNVTQPDSPPTEAPAGFDNLTNGFLSQPDFDLARATFNEIVPFEKGVGPLMNALACGECHASPVAGAASQINNLRAGRLNGSNFVEHAGGSLIQDRAVDVSIQEHVASNDSVRVFRTSLNTLGDGFVEAISNNTLLALSAAQAPEVRGTLINVPVLEAGGVLRAGRFGWKNQHASLLSLAADEYLNQIGITSPLKPSENNTRSNPVGAFDVAPDPEDPATPTAAHGEDVEAFVAFMRSTKVPPRGPITPEGQAGQSIFSIIGCGACHVSTITTAPEGTIINGGAFVVPAALANKLIHPYSDFLLHNVGSGDGIVQNGSDATRNMVRTAPLWGLRARTRFMHDGASLLLSDAIFRHAGQATAARNAYQNLTNAQKNNLMAFLGSL
jgi:CxxC motif-containing protein (DUF1111 family)